MTAELAENVCALLGDATARRMFGGWSDVALLDAASPVAGSDGHLRRSSRPLPRARPSRRDASQRSCGFATGIDSSAHALRSALSFLEG